MSQKTIKAKLTDLKTGSFTINNFCRPLVTNIPYGKAIYILQLVAIDCMVIVAVLRTIHEPQVAPRECRS